MSGESRHNNNRPPKPKVAVLPENVDPKGVKVSLAALSVYEQMELNHKLGIAGTRVENYTLVLAKGNTAGWLRSEIARRSGPPPSEEEEDDPPVGRESGG